MKRRTSWLRRSSTPAFLDLRNEGLEEHPRSRPQRGTRGTSSAAERTDEESGWADLIALLRWEGEGGKTA